MSGLSPWPLSPRQIQLITTSFETLVQDAEGVSDLFYRRLFVLEPGLRPLFKHDRHVQGHKLMVMLGSVVANLDRLESVIPMLHQLGARHVGDRVEDRHYATLAQVLLWTLEDGLRSAFTAEVREAWTALYGFVEQTIKEGARAATRTQE